MRVPKTFSIEETLLADLERTRGASSTSERVNELLKRALELEQADELEREAAAFFATQRERSARPEERGFLKASLRSFARD